ncbi:MAG: hypothetical protein J5519_07615, partial [Bacteroidales bacterium]|nr:hypothetical protein [Bacteroidales bacterium]
MRKWEDIVRDKLEGYESALPEGSLADFHARRGSTAAGHTGRRWIWVAAVAVAAGLAAVLFLHRPSAPENVIQVVPQPSAPVASVVDTVVMEEPAQPLPLIAQTARPKLVREVTKPRETVENELVIEEPEDLKGPEEPEQPGQPEQPEQIIPEELPTSSPFIPASPFKDKRLKLEVAPAAGIVAGSGLLAALVTPISRSGIYIAKEPINIPDGPVPNGGNIENSNGGSSITDDIDDIPPPENYGSTDDNTSVEDPVYQEVHKEDVLSGNYTHYLPVKAGISARIPLTERLSVTTGLQYALYISKFTYSLSGEKRQYAHYLGTPARLDWSFASNRWLDVYAGAGMKAEVCLGASLAGNKLKRDPIGFSLLGAAGIQLNLSERI